MKIYYANVTSWHQTAMEYLTMDSSLQRADVMAIAEHHLKGDKLVQMIKTLSRLQWKVSVEGAAETGTTRVREGRGHGGVWVGARSHLQQHGLSLDSKRAVQAEEHQGLSTQWTARTVRTAGYDILVVVVYLAPALGLQGTNLITLQEIGIFIRAQGKPYVLVGDFNMEIPELAPIQMDYFLGGRWLSPAEPPPGGHRTIDLVLLADCLIPGTTLTWPSGPLELPALGPPDRDRHAALPADHPRHRLPPDHRARLRP
jgi:hypothetical protein